MCHNRILALEPVRTLSAVVLAQARQILRGLGSLVLFEVLWGSQIGLDLVEIAQVATGLGASLLVRNTHFEIYVIVSTG